MSDLLNELRTRNNAQLNAIRDIHAKVNLLLQAANGAEEDAAEPGRLYSDIILSAAGKIVTMTPRESGQIALFGDNDFDTYNLPPTITLDFTAATSGKKQAMYLYVDHSSTDATGDNPVIAAEYEAWTNETTRATVLESVSGVLLKSTDHTRRWVGDAYYDGTTVSVPGGIDPLAGTWFGTGNPNSIDSSTNGIGMQAPGVLISGTRYNLFSIQAGTLMMGVSADDGTVYAQDGVFDGTIYAHAGTIGGFTITDDYLIREGAGDSTAAGIAPEDYPFYAGMRYANRAVAPFRVTTAGALYASSATISGAITATTGAIGGWAISATALKDAAGTVGMSSVVTDGDDIRFWAGNTTPGSAPFRVTEAGVLTASSGTIAGWSISSTTLQKLTANVGIVLDSSGPTIKVGDTGATYVAIDGANHRIVSSNYASGLLGSVWDTSTGNAEFNNVTVRGAIRSTVLQYGYVTATNGTLLVTPASGVLRDDCTSVNSPTTFPVNIKDPDGMSHAAAGTLWTVGDVIRMKEPLTGDLWATISSKIDNTTYWTLNVVKQQPGAGTNYTFRAGLGVVDYGASGSGFIAISADGALGSTPNITLATHAGSPWTTYSNYMRVGNLANSYGYGASTVYGVGMGAYGSTGQPALTLDTTNGLRIFNNTTVRVGISTAGVMTINDSAGTAVFTFDASAGAYITKVLNMSGASAAIAVGSTPPASATVGTGLWIDRTGLYSLSSNVQNIKIDSSGISAVVTSAYAMPTSYKFMDGSSNWIGGMSGLADSGASQDSIRINSWSIPGYDALMFLNVLAPAGKNAELQLQAGVTGGSSSTLSMYGYGCTLVAPYLNVYETDAVTSYVYFDGTNGRLGVGTSFPGYTLDVNGTLHVSGFSTLSSGKFTVGTDQNLLVTSDGSIPCLFLACVNDLNNAYTVMELAGSKVIINSTGGSGNVGIGTSSPHSTAILDVQSTTQGFRLPRMTTTQRNAISVTPAGTIMVFDTTVGRPYYYNGASWVQI